MTSATIYRPARPDLELYRGDCVSYILSNPRNVPNDKKVLIDPLTGQFRTHGDVQQRTRSLAHGLRELGVKPKSVVGLFSPNTIDYAITCFAIIGCGATVSPANAALTPAELAAQLETNGAEILIVHSSLKQTAAKAIEQVPTVRKLIIADGAPTSKNEPTANFLAETCPASDLIAISPDECETRLAFLCFSSGTTGKSKGVMTSHQNITSNMQQWMGHRGESFEESMTCVGFLPLSHIYALSYYVCLCTWLGNTSVTMPRFDLKNYLTYIQEYRPKELVMVPPVVLLLTKDPLVAKYDLSSVKKVLSAAAPLSPELRTAFDKRIKELYGTKVFTYQCYGATETSPLVTGVKDGRWDKRETVGDLVPHMRARLVDPETMKDIERGSGKPGELWCQGPNIALGYYKNPVATEETFHIDKDGQRWYRTGDITVVDKDGFFIIVDRIKEMIKFKGFQVVPSELEGKLVDHPMVTDACVIGVWHEDQATELPVGFVVLSQEAKSSSNTKEVISQIHEYINARVANHKRLRGGIVLVDAIPKSPTGKILRRICRDQFVKKATPQSKL